MIRKIDWIRKSFNLPEKPKQCFTGVLNKRLEKICYLDQINPLLEAPGYNARAFFRNGVIAL